MDGVIHAMRAVMAGMRGARLWTDRQHRLDRGDRYGLPGNTFYSATKAEVIILTRRFAMELGPAASR